MHPVFESYLDPRFRFVFTQGPTKVRSRDQAFTDGTNCVALAHLVIRDLFGFTLPGEIRSLELYLDDTFFDHDTDAQNLEVGDLLLLGHQTPDVPLDDFVPRFDGDELINFEEFAINHVAIGTGVTDGSDPLLLHANPIDGTNSIWRLSRFGEYERWSRVYQRLRLKSTFRQQEL